MAEKLKPCPFCGRKMVFYKETYKNMHGRQCTRQYYMHEDYDINKEESCILDDIDMPFTIGAGDARPDTGYIGEYGEKWNRRIQMAEYISKHEPIDEIQRIYCTGCNSYNGAMCRACEHQDDMDIIEDTKAADVQPVKRGTWENTNKPNQLRCSNCEIIHFIAQYPHGDIKYCPNCGARMDGGK